MAASRMLLACASMLRLSLAFSLALVRPELRVCSAAVAVAPRTACVPGRRAADVRMSASDDGEGSSDWEKVLQQQLSSLKMREAKFGDATELLNARQMAWVLLFNPEQHDEGVYTLQGRENSPSCYIVSFEHYEEAWRFAHQLEGEGFDLATPTEWSATQISSFCETAGFRLSFVPAGALVIPPTTNVYDDSFEGDAEQHKHKPSASKKEKNKPKKSSKAVEDAEHELIEAARARLENMWNDDPAA